MNIPAIAIHGDPHNYRKHGFRNGIDYEVGDLDGEHPLGLLVLEPEKGFFGKRTWKLRQSDVFKFEPADVEEFDKRFPEREKKWQYSQELFKTQNRAFLRNERPSIASTRSAVPPRRGRIDALPHGGLGMELHYEITADEYIEFNIDFLEHSKTTDREIRKWRIIFVASMPLYVLLLSYLFKADMIAPLVAGGLYCAYMLFRVVNLKKSYYKKVERRIRKIMDEGTGVKSIGPKSLRIEDDKLEYVGEEEKSECKVSSLVHLRETPNTILLYRDGVSAYIVSKSAFRDPAEASNFMRMLQGRIGAAKAAVSVRGSPGSLHG